MNMVRFKKVSRISLATNEQTLSNKENKVNAYLVQVNLTDGLKTNYGTVLNFSCSKLKAQQKSSPKTGD